VQEVTEANCRNGMCLIVSHFSPSSVPPTSSFTLSLNGVEVCFLLDSYSFCRSPWRIRWAGHVARLEEMRNAYKIFVGKPWRRWEDNIRMDLRETGWESVDWMYLAQDRDQWRAVVKTVMNLRVP